jgi:phosphate starvation-inducible PhoH-like protein
LTFGTSEFFEDNSASASRRPSRADARKARKTLKVEKQAVRSPPPFKPKTPAQAEYAECIDENAVTFGVGGAGVGKTYVPSRKALQDLIAGKYEKIIITRPMVPVSGESIGFLPGGVDEKCYPWAIPIIDAFCEGASKATVEKMMKDGKIDFVPFALIRGRTFNNAFVIADESQNLTVEQFKVLITRLGEDSKIVITGDLGQTDIKGKNGLEYAIRVAEHCNLDAEIFEFEDTDVVRSKVVAEWVLAFSEYGDK